MEAATPLRRSNVSADEQRLRVHDLVVEDETVVRVVRERIEAGEDPARVVTDAVEIGARVLDREQAAANTEFVKTEFERASRDLQAQFTEHAGKVAERLDQKVDEVFGEEDGHLAKELEKLFSDGSSVAVQNRVRELVAQTMQHARDDLLKQFSAADGRNPLADFKQGALETIQQAAKRQDDTSRALLVKLGELDKQVQGLRDEKQRLEE